ncbi:thaumatin-like protein [Neltuma alba]|uniref:thaumatin-like protein n=1 Tax=Neltuma alba TaxID=207710 RepID=UPI0010A37974|nr:thaumatin-like protein [Prosopis alba]XP_028800424.1 thaumatin-like protein [Prosopis alba]
MTPFKSLFVFSLLLALSFTFSEAATFEITNKCSYTVWPASLPTGGGQQLNPGETWSLQVAPGTANARIWGRTGCNFDGSGHGHCDTGDCGGVLQCQLSGAPPATLAEFSLNQPNNLDFYDISVIDGFNIPMEFSPTSNGCSLSLQCPADKCPDAYLYPADNSKNHSCPGGTNYKIVFCP